MKMNRLRIVAICLCCACSVLALGQARPHRAAQSKAALKEKLQATEAKFAKMADSSSKAADQLSKIEAELDQLVKSLHDMRMRFEGKPNP